MSILKNLFSTSSTTNSNTVSNIINPNYRQKFFNPYGYTDLYFYNRYEEPTYLSFKVEFGDWGASLLDESTIKSQSAYLTNSLSMDYDAFPCGLMDLNFNDSNPDTLGEMFKEGNSLTTLAYNSVNYLYSMHQDQRAKYLKAFIQGMYQIQREYQYVFKKISGVEKLLNFKADSGARIPKDTKISIECYDFLDQRMRTLLNLYRKAAWDDVWQRWVLPDIYRSFKMIIYIAEFRSSHTGETGSLLNTKNTSELRLDNYNNGVSNKLKENCAETMLPVFAFECMPCELDIPNKLFNNDYETFSNAESNFTFDITVKNVKTFQTNKLMNKLGVISVGDLLNTDAAYNGSTIDGSINNDSLYNLKQEVTTAEQYRYMWLRHDFFTNDYKLPSIQAKHNYNDYNKNFESQMKSTDYEYTVNGFETSALLINAIGRSNSFVRLVTDLFFKITGIDSLNILNKSDYNREWKNYYKNLKFNDVGLANWRLSENLQDVSIINNTDSSLLSNIIKTTIKDTSLDTSFLEAKLKNLTTSNILLNVNTDYENTVITQIIDTSLNTEFDKNEEYKQLLKAVEYLHQNEDAIKKSFLSYINNLKTNLINNTTYLDNINKAIKNDRSWATDMDGGPETSASQMATIKNNIKSKQPTEFAEIIDNSSINQTNMPKINNTVIIPTTEMPDIIDDISLNNMDMNSIINNISTNISAMPDIIDDINLASFTGVSIINNVSTNKTEMPEIKKSIKLNKNAMPNIINDISSNNNMNNAIINTDISVNTSLKDVSINNDLINNKIQMPELVYNDHITKLELQKMEDNLKLPDYKIPDITTDVSTISFTQLTTIANDLETSNIQLTKIINSKLDINPNINMAKLEQPKDRSITTDLDGGPEITEKEMVHENKETTLSTATKKRNIEI